MLVKDLLCPVSKEWNTSVIRSNLPQYEDAIRSITISQKPLHDSLIWLPEKSGIYSTKTGYHLACISTPACSDTAAPFNWIKNVWQIKTAPKIKHFLWKAARGALSLGSNLAKRGLMASINCKRFGEREDETHLFFSCPFAQQVWNASPLNHQVSQGLNQNFKTLLSNSLTLKVLPPTGLSGSPLPPWLMWNLWKARNYLIFEDRSFTIQEIVLKAIREAKEWSCAQSALPKQAAKPAAQRQHLTNSAAHKCFVDAAWSATTGVCGLGWIFLDPQENAPVKFSASRRYVSSALSAEAFALRSALFSWQLVQANETASTPIGLEIHSDSQVLISTINSNAHSKELKAILHDISSICRELPPVSFHFVPRLNNVLSDSLAKSALYAANSFSPCGV